MDNRFNNFNDEIRDEFLVDSRRKRIWQVQLDIYFKLLEVCKKYNLKPFATGGTLLGAIRHNGFIPWDDDFDVAFTRNDFDKLYEVAEKEFSYPYFFQTGLTDKNYFIGFARLRKSDTTGIVKYFSDKVYNNGLYVDIYIYDKAPEDQKEFDKLIKKINKKIFHIGNYHYSLKEEKNITLKRVFKSIYFFMFRLFNSYEKVYKSFNKLITLYRDTDTNRVVYLCNPYFIKYEATNEGVNNLIPHKFEFFEILVPSDYEFELKSAYGDYMQFPPVEQRGKWHENSLIIDPDISYFEYYKNHSDQFKNVIDSYLQIGVDIMNMKFKEVSK